MFFIKTGKNNIVLLLYYVKLKKLSLHESKDIHIQLVLPTNDTNLI